MRFFLSGYYGYDNAGDEAVLAAILDHVSAQVRDAEFVVTSGVPWQTEILHAGQEYSIRAVPRQGFKTLWREIKSCDAFVSGGGSLLQDATSLRNVVYYTGLIRMAHTARTPLMIYAQGMGPLRKTLSQKLTRAAIQNRRTRVVTVRDPDSERLLRNIGVRRAIEVTADPVWALSVAECGVRSAERRTASPVWCVSLRSWLNASTPDAERELLHAIQKVAKAQNATLKYLAMQPSRDLALIEDLGVSPDEILPTENLHPRETMALAGACDLMIAMRLHALIFAAAQGVPCVAVSYDPKVKSLAGLIGAPVIESANANELAKLPEAIAAAQAPSTQLVEELKAKARRNAGLAASLIAR